MELDHVYFLHTDPYNRRPHFLRAYILLLTVVTSRKKNLFSSFYLVGLVDKVKNGALRYDD